MTTAPGARAGDGSYATAYRLLSALSTVAGQLADGLDSATLAERLLGALGEAATFDRAEVLVNRGGSRLVPLAVAGRPRPDEPSWDADLSHENAFADAWVSESPQVRDAQHACPNGDWRPGSALAVPLRMGVRTFGVVGCETGAPGAYPADVVESACAVVAAAALPLATALLFDDVRAGATAEERRRVAREIHDSTAQDLVSVGYALDELAGEAAGDADVAVRLREIRADVRRIVRDLRLSISDLRTEVEQHGGLAAALAEYVRAVAASAPFAVHLSITETSVRLPADVEAELLRIAQEAITNARRHAHAANLWVSCDLDPPYASLTVEDDGVGLPARRRAGAFGLLSMQERANRVRAELHAGPRPPCGTRVVVVLGRRPDQLASDEPTRPQDERVRTGGR